MAEAKPVHDAGPEVLGNDIEFRGDLEKQFPPAWVLEVNRHRALVPVECMKRRRVVADEFTEHRHPAHPVAGSRPLDLDDVGPQIGQCLGAERTQHHLCEVENANSFEGALHQPS